jgi:uncharacterized membrane protein YgaE (UPF0421/DUF939 family)
MWGDSMKHIHSIVKVVSVTVLATVIAYFLGIMNYLTTGILAMISIQKTKSLSLEIAFRRTVMVLISIVVASFLFYIFGFSLVVYSVIVLFVVFVSYTCSLTEGMIPSVVVITHLLVFNEFSILFTLETVLLYVIAVGVALLFNLFYPSESTMKLLEYQRKLDQLIVNQILYLRDKISSSKGTCDYTKNVEKEIEELLLRIEQVTGDLILGNHDDILRYSNMRRAQFEILKSICSQSDRLENHYPQTTIVVNYLNDLSQDIGIQDKATNHLNQIDTMLLEFQKEELPKTRVEFESRAILYHIVLEIRQFLLLKIEYHAIKNK